MRPALLLHLLFILFASKLAACPAGYESPESLVRHARLILQVEVLSVEEAPLPPGLHVRPSSDEYGRKLGQAHIKVLQVIKGECTSREFTLIGGPYHTCAPYLMYHGFTVGAKRMLVLETSLPPDVKKVVVTWRNRLLDESPEQIKVLMEKARIGWRLAVARHRRACPEEMASAELLHAEFIKNPAGFKAPSGTSYAALSCLAVLSNDPDNLPVKEYSKDDAPDRLGAFADLYASQGAYLSAGDSRDVVPGELRAFLPKPNSSEYILPAEARQFNEKMIKTILEDELFVPPSLSGAVLANPKLNGMWERPQTDSFWPHLDRPIRGTETGDSMALYYLMLLADPEPDALIWGGIWLGG